MSKLLELAERCEQATGPDFDLSHDIARALVGHSGYSYRPYTASLDAAMTLVPKGWFAKLDNHPFGPECSVAEVSAQKWRVRSRHSNKCATPALALCAAALKARASTEGAGG